MLAHFNHASSISQSLIEPRHEEKAQAVLWQQLVELIWELAKLEEFVDHIFAANMIKFMASSDQQLQVESCTAFYTLAPTAIMVVSSLHAS